MLNVVKPFIAFYRVTSSKPPAPARRDFWRIWQCLTHGWRAARRYRRLEVMSDREQARIGLDRASIGRHAFFGDFPSGRG